MELTDEIRNYFFNNGVAVIETKATGKHFVYITTDDESPLYRYPKNNPEILQHDVGDNVWHDIRLGVRREQTALF
ncbi:hypothetical protein FEZ51_02035 [Pediococcus stilesii]|uniref:Uncharacterized protein n=1 Tax=Pediococcus stilesii TaxID=331679 RepID=A0A5R9BZD3_9LACO|nr:hypothetical protein [Pediococcus stilesii]TLQ05461.1 hypothetical protein FEZ51_02035 [Pediococcus stilesii]